MIHEAVVLLRLLQVASPQFPIGGYNYSQGLEWAVEAGAVHDEASAAHWIGDVIDYTLSRFEAPIVLRMYRAWADDDTSRVGYWNEQFLAARETAEMRAEALQMGYSACRLFNEANFWEPRRRALLAEINPISYPAAYTFACREWGVRADDAVLSYLWTWLENQVAVAVKTIPLGQVGGQRLLTALSTQIAVAAEAACGPEDEFVTALPALAIASCQHETQFARLFRS